MTNPDVKNPETLNQKKKTSVDRVVLSVEAAAKIDSWIARITATRHGVELSRRDVVDWLISSHMAEKLSPAEEKELADLHYDEVKFLHYAIRELKDAQGRGENVSLQDLIMRVQTTPKISRPKKKKPIVTESLTADAEEQNTNEKQ